MAQNTDNGAGDVKAVSSAHSSQEVVSKNKRKAYPTLESISPSPPVFPPCLLPLEKPQMPGNEVGHVGSEGRVLAEVFELADWDDPIACQLEELLFSGLRTIYRNAIKRIVERGYDEKVAEKFLSRHGLYNGGLDLVSNVVNDTLDLLKEGVEGDTARDHMFEDVEHLVQYTMLEMVSVLCEVKPSLSIGDAMWCLLMCDLNISFACEVGDILHELDCKEVPRESNSTSSSRSNSGVQNDETTNKKPKDSSVSKPSVTSSSNAPPEAVKFGSFPHFRKPKNSTSSMFVTSETESMVSAGAAAAAEYFQALSQASISEEKSGFGRKCRSKKELAALRKKTFTVEKYRACGKGSFRSGRVASLGGFIVEKRVKNPSDFPVVNGKGGSLPAGTNSGSSSDRKLQGLTISDVSVANNSSTVAEKDATSYAANAKLTDSSSIKKAPLESEGSAYSLKTTDCHREQEFSSNSESKTALSFDACNYYAGIPYDKSLGKYVPKDEKDELILKLVPQLHELQSELHRWTEWANQKVMQATRRLSKEQPELKSLRQEKEEAEQLNAEKQMMEDNTVKRLREMEDAFNKATTHVESANSSLRRLEVEHSLLKEELEAAKLQASESAESFKEALERERNAQKDFQSSEGKKGFYQEELQGEKQKAAEFQQEVGKVKNLHNQIMARWKQESMAKDKLLSQVKSIRKEREQLEAAAKAEEETIKLKAEKDKQVCCEDIKKLESKLFELKMEQDFSKIQALRHGTAGGYANQIPSFSKQPISLAENFACGGLKPECECVMCLSEEKTVVFLPCTHQVLCVKCNELHEKQGMNDCPSCRTPIKRRIRARFALAQPDIACSRLRSQWVR